MAVWTPDQEKVISAPAGKGNIIVSAAAGSGKTAVLVERVVQRIIGGASIDRMLIVTFTNAAAAEMRERIIKRLTAALDDAKNEKTVRHLRRQVQLSESADIMTIDAFCIRTVQNNFYVLDRDPDVGIADEALAVFMQAEALEAVMTELYKTEDEKEQTRFARLTDAYSSNRDDRGLCETVLDIYKFITSFAEPEKWLDKAAEGYRLPPLETPYARRLMRITRDAAKRCIENIEEIMPETEAFPELREYAQMLLFAAQDIIAETDWDKTLDICKGAFKYRVGKMDGKHTFTVPSPPISENIALSERLSYIGDVFAARLSAGAAFESARVEKDLERSDALAEAAEDIAWIVKRFMREYAAVKDRRRVLEFSDFEHLTYDLFSTNGDIREVYRDKYDEILIDEYQDTNGLQDGIFELISHDNIFMVGDLKQSIYLFRGGDPYIFKDKSETYGADGAHHRKITLAQNFRSRIEVLDSVNDVFTAVMSDEAGDVDYRGKELVVRDKERDYYPLEGSGCRAELHYIRMDGSAEERRTEEIIFTVNKIKELLGSDAKVYDTGTGKMRPIRKKDIVILDSTRAMGARMAQELARAGIDAYCDTKLFFSRREIRVMISLLSLINNMRQDIPLAAVMRSPIGGFSDNDLARIRLFTKNTDCFLNAVKEYAKKPEYRLKDKVFCRAAAPKKYTSGTRKQLSAHCRGFLADLNRWRGYVRRMSVAQLIWTIYEETYFYDIMGAIEFGEEAQLNLRLLYERAKQYERAGFRGLFSFIKYIELTENSSKDVEGAKAVGENNDVVRIMTIHKSKGLEFPYVFLINTGSGFSRSDGVSAVRRHKELGLGVRDINYKGHYTQNTVVYDLIYETNKRERRAESMRLLYVALTRARERLFVTAAVKHPEDVMDEDIIKSYTDKLVGGRMLPVDALAAKGMYGWICPAAFASKDTWKCEFHHASAAESEAPYESMPEEVADKDAVKRAVYDILDYRYPYTEGSTVPSRTSVTQLKELTIERGIDEPVYEPDSRRSSGADDMAELMFSPLHRKPAFMREKGDKPANEIGTLYHTVMSELDLDRLRAEGAECIEMELARLVDCGKIAPEDIRNIDADRIKRFAQSELCRRMLASDEVRREAPFQINIPATLYDPSLPDSYADETVILQGIIDCFFKEGDGYVLVDYKTDRVKESGAPEIRARYEKQLELYTMAIERLLRSSVKESLLYLFDTGETV
ncbi:MAG: helicase-exonuclease AddAB subunit AddA [Clostridia bacterium]|nr:helicase-exonuclease AddAB subunit AddA [Clostridia bacterium]